MGILDVFFNSSVEDIVRKADSMPDAPEHTLEYYNNQSEDPCANLSNREKRLIAQWMEWSKYVPLKENEAKLTFWQNFLSNRWMKKSLSAPLVMEERSDENFITKIWNKLCEDKYQNDLSSYIIAERKAAEYRNSNKNK